MSSFDKKNLSGRMPEKKGEDKTSRKQTTAIRRTPDAPAAETRSMKPAL